MLAHMNEPAREVSELNSPEVEAAYAALPEGTPAAILDGELHVMTRPGPPHLCSSSSLGGELYAPFQRGRGGPGGWIFFDEPELHLGRRPDKLAPDLAGWRRERLPELPETAAFTLPPDWICEVLSEGTERLDRIKKARIYAREGVAHYWLVHPVQRTLEVLRNEGGRWVAVAGFAVEDGDALIRAEPFDAIELDLGALFRV
jgi:Uma2 family endonuclease